MSKNDFGLIYLASLVKAGRYLKLQGVWKETNAYNNAPNSKGVNALHYFFQTFITHLSFIFG